MRSCKMKSSNQHALIKGSIINYQNERITKISQGGMATILSIKHYKSSDQELWKGVIKNSFANQDY